MRLQVAVIILGVLVALGTARASTSELIEKSYSASYLGPAPVPEVPEVVPADPKKPTVVELLNAWYAGEIRKANEALAGELKKIDAGTYNTFLKEYKAKALACAGTLPETLRADVEAFLSASNVAEQEPVVRRLRKGAEGQPKKVLDCLNATLVKLDSRSVLIGGLPWGKTSEGTERLKPTLYNPGQVYVLQPQVLTAWPGRADSALRVLDPRQGPWKVRLAHTYEDKVQAHGQSWKRRSLLRVQEYARLTSNGHFLLVDDKDVPLGWLDMDQAAFFEQEWAQHAERSRFVYTSGAAAFAHGAWWSPEGRADETFGSDRSKRYQTPVYILDLLRQVQLQSVPAERLVGAPYPEVLSLTHLRAPYRDTEDPESLSYSFELLVDTRHALDEPWVPGGRAGEITEDDARLRHQVGSASVKTALKDIYPLLTSSSAAGPSLSRLIEESYSGSYPGPAPVPEVPVVAPADPSQPTVVELLGAWYAGEIRKGNEALARELQKADASAYTASLKALKAKALACSAGLPAELRADAAVFLSTSTAEEHDAAIRKLLTTAGRLPKEMHDCVSATLLKLDSRGVLVGGLVWGKTAQGTEQLKPTLYNPGQVYILRPQVLTAWPGRLDSTLQVLDPRQGPWKVRLAHTYEQQVKTHSQKWKQRLSISVQEYLGLTNRGHFLLVDGEDRPLGWLDMDQAAFFEEGWTRFAGNSKFIYTSGAAAFVHGVWWNPEGRTGDEIGSDPRKRYQDPIYVLDLLNLVQAETETTDKPVDAPYPKFLRLRGLRSLYQGRDVSDSYTYKIILSAHRRNSYDEVWRVGEEVGSITEHQGRLYYGIGSATTRTTLQKLYHLP